MAVARTSRRIHGSAEDIWRVVSDPYHLPRWWPRVTRVEHVQDGCFTEVMRTAKGKTVRADFAVVETEEGAGTVVWRQQLEGTPFAGVLSHSETELRVAPLGEGERTCEVTIEMRQELSGRELRESEIDGAPRTGTSRRLQRRRCRASAGGCCAARPRARSKRRSTAWSGSVAEAGGGERAMRWWGWGRDDRAGEGLPEHARTFLQEHVGTAGSPRPPVALEQVALEPSALGEQDRAALSGLLGAEHVREDHLERVLHAAGKGYPDLVRMRAGELEGAPDAIVHPGGHEQLRALLSLCAERSLAVVPFGGGTSVVGGVAPLRGAHRAVLAVDLGRLDGLLGLDERSMTATVGAGMRAPELERLLAGRGLTLGHYPQSYEHVTLGGCAATRSAGQSSTGYGSIEKMVLGMRLAAPAGEIVLPPLPATAAGPGLRQLLVGSEGTLGVISELSLRLRAAPASRRYEGASSTTSPRDARRCGSSRAGTCCQTSRACPTGPRRRCRWRWRAYTARRTASGAPTSARGAMGAAASPSSASRAPSTTSRRGAGAHCSWYAAAVACRSAPRPARRGAPGASRLPTCATTCSGSA